MPYERAGQIFEVFFQEARHVGGYRHDPTEGYGAGKTLQCGVQAGLSPGSACSARNVAGSIVAGFFQCPAECKQPIEDALCGHHGGPQSLCETAVLLPRPSAEFVRRQERDRPVLEVSPGPFSPGGNRIAGGGTGEAVPLRVPETLRRSPIFEMDAGTTERKSKNSVYPSVNYRPDHGECRIRVSASKFLYRKVSPR